MQVGGLNNYDGGPYGVLVRKIARMKSALRPILQRKDKAIQFSITPRSTSSREDRINKFGTQIEDSKYAKLHNRVLACCVCFFSVSGSNYVAKDSLKGAADHGVT